VDSFLLFPAGLEGRWPRALSSRQHLSVFQLETADTLVTGKIYVGSFFPHHHSPSEIQDDPQGDAK